jgi:hypothetical protein
MTTPLSPATITRLEKAAVDNGFDRDLGRDGEWLGFAPSPRALSTARKRLQCPAFAWISAAFVASAPGLTRAQRPTV